MSWFDVVRRDNAWLWVRTAVEFDGAWIDHDVSPQSTATMIGYLYLDELTDIHEVEGTSVVDGHVVQAVEAAPRLTGENKIELFMGRGVGRSREYVRPLTAEELADFILGLREGFTWGMSEDKKLKAITRDIRESLGLLSRGKED